MTETGTGRVIRHAKSFKGVFRPPGDKSVSHRALMIGALADGETRIRGLAVGGDVHRTAACLRALGVHIEQGTGPDGAEAVVKGTGAYGAQPGGRLGAPGQELDCGNSGTTARLLAGLLAGQGIEATLTGDESLCRRPMDRVARPLRRMGAEVTLNEGDTLPMSIRGGGLSGITYSSPVASAQVKSAVLLAALGADGVTEHTEPIRSRDHTERMLKEFGASIASRASGGGRAEYTVRLEPGAALTGRSVDVPGDFSSALYLVVAALLIPRSDLILKEVGLNPSRSEALKVLQRMGAGIEISERRTLSGESRGDLRVTYSKLKGTSITGASVPWLIDEIPALAVAAAFAEGETYFKGAEELRHKESDRIAAIAGNLRSMGLEVGDYPDGFVLRGKPTHDGTEFDSHGDHRIAMAFYVAAVASHGESVLHGPEAMEVSWPEFPEVMQALAGG